ncbi:helix-turn-helix domain-containing protein [Natrinema halophilum]|uniref:Helix-turn-helix domain-containing protein n=1 Tax=Natrinema halophilum TaxID=1699371 RepID=A0A7D5GIV6_9EURY|nr:helix-turn-helix domain-containing protein [Natrinema halophilum]QLG47830.1 helix-turn-helix domain-containing protein [Natrinema halophilum]
MATIAEFTVGGDDFPLGSIFEELPTVTVELDRLVPTNKTILPYFWVWGRDMERVADVIADQPEILSVTIVDELEGGGLFRAVWDEQKEGILTAIAESDVVLTRGEGTGERGKWVFEFRVESLDSLSEFQQYCREHDIDLTLNRLFTLAEMQTGGKYNLTSEQHEALVLAFNEGYYNDPRETNLEELAEMLGITRPSVTSRLHRGYRNLIGSTLIHTKGGD